MSDFEISEWAKDESCREYLDTADHYVVERRTLMGIVASFYKRFVGVGNRNTLLDLGCGDGVLAETLCSVDNSLKAIEVDGSPEMLDAARRRLARFSNTEFCRKTFQDLLSDQSVQWCSVDLIASSFAIHHLVSSEKQALFAAVLQMLKNDGYFLNVDVVLPGSPSLEDWYYELWEAWIADHQSRLRLDKDFRNVPSEARSRPDNKYEDLDSQLRMLRSVGFVDVECHYRYGLFGVYGGRKPGC